MRKYFTLFGISFQNEFTYRLNFILWRLRNVIRILMVFILWNSVFSSNRLAFGYTKEQMLTYVFLVLIVSTLVASAPSNDNIGGEISSGALSNYLVKPVNYLKYWLTRDWSSKLLNIIFASLEIGLLYWWFKPTVIFTNSPLQFILGITMVTIAALIFYYFTKIVIMASFWTPENTWGFMFTFLVLFEILAGSVFPLDILPQWTFKLLQLTPFPYLIYLPIATLVGKLSLYQSLQYLFQALIWLGLSWYGAVRVWNAGQKAYDSAGR